MSIDTLRDHIEALEKRVSALENKLFFVALLGSAAGGSLSSILPMLGG